MFSVIKINKEIKYYLVFKEQVLSASSCRQWSLTGSNRWPPACKAGALPAELIPHEKYKSQSLKSKQALTKHCFLKMLKNISWWIPCERVFICTLERRWSNRRFSYGYLVTTSPQSLIPLWRVASLASPLRVKSTPMVWRAVSTRPGNVFTVAWLIYDY